MNVEFSQSEAIVHGINNQLADIDAKRKDLRAVGRALRNSVNEDKERIEAMQNYMTAMMNVNRFL